MLLEIEIREEVYCGEGAVLGREGRCYRDWGAALVEGIEKEPTDCFSGDECA